MATTATAPPDVIVPGTTVKWTSSFSDYPASAGWTLKVYLAGLSQFAGGNGIAGSASGNDFAFTLSTTDTNLLAGGYRWQLIATKSGETYLAASGVLTVLEGVAGAAAGSGSFLEEQLVVVEAAINKRLTADMESYQIAGRAVVKIPMNDLFRLRAEIKAALYRERNPGRIGPSSRIAFGPRS